MTHYNYLQYACGNREETRQLEESARKYESLGYQKGVAQELAFLERVVMFSLYNPPSKK